MTISAESPLDLSPPAATVRRAREAAEAAAIDTLLNCYVREGGEHRLAPGAPPLAVLPLRGGRGAVKVGVARWTRTFRHRFVPPVLHVLPDGSYSAVGSERLGELLVQALGRGAGRPDVLAARMRESVAAVEAFLAARDAEIDALWGPEPLPFGATEQALLLGHPLHPTPKSRSEMGYDLLAYAPESAARFRLRWLAADPALVVHGSAAGAPAPELTRRLLLDDPEADPAVLEEAAGRVLLPAHPWELEHLRGDPEVAALLAAGALVDLGELGGEVAATTSVRTVFRPEWAWQLKFSLHVRVTNSMRVTLPKELERSVEAARLLQTPVGAAAARVAPRFAMLQDPAYLAVRGPGGTLLEGLSVLLRENRWPAGCGIDVTSVATLCQDHPYGGRSRLGAIVGAIAARSGRSEPDVAREWFARYCDAVVVSLVRLYLELGLCMEPHQQNVLLELEDGWPERGVYRDSQGYFHREAAHADLASVIPGLGEESESIFPEALADERLVYYPFVNNALGVANALALAGCADEEELLADLRALLERERARGGRYPATLLDRLLDDATWPCKANLLTRLHDLDELVGDIAEQSIYVTLPNPLRLADS